MIQCICSKRCIYNKIYISQDKNNGSKVFFLLLFPFQKIRLKKIGFTAEIYLILNQANKLKKKELLFLTCCWSLISCASVGLPGFGAPLLAVCILRLNFMTCEIEEKYIYYIKRGGIFKYDEAAMNATKSIKHLPSIFI